MKSPNPLDLDGHALRLLLTVLEEGSVTAAAERLGVTQSTVSHALERLRGIVGAPLFVKSGRGIVATAHAHALAGPARELLDGIRRFATPASFDPAQARLSLTVAANDFQRDLLLPAFFQRARRQLAELRLRVLPSGTPSPELLRAGHCDLLITPRPPEGADIVQTLLLEDRYVCFHDPRVRAAPSDLADYLAAEHVGVVHDDRGPLEFDRRLSAAGIQRNFVATVQSFYGVPPFIRGTSLLATLPSLLARELMRDLAASPAPTGHDRLPMYLVWHQRDHLAPAHQWLRTVMREVATDLRNGDG